MVYVRIKPQYFLLLTSFYCITQVILELLILYLCMNLVSWVNVSISQNLSQTVRF
jgi:hypothetical protein